MTYEESAALMNDTAFRGRIKVCCLKYADSIIGEPTGSAAHNTRLRWAVQTMQAPEMTATQIQPPTVMDANVQFYGPEITDEALQSSVEAVVNKLM